MDRLDITDYRPPFITETDESAWDDCTVCSTLMATATATRGETVANRDWTPMTPAKLKVLRERIRNHLGPGHQKGSSTMADMRKAFGIEYPWLPQIPYYDVQDNTWDNLLTSLSSFDGCAVLMGNPYDVKNFNSKLRRWTNNDNFGHAMYADHVKKNNGVNQFYIMDPLGRGNYDGEYIDADEVREFLWTYGTFVKATIFPRGDWSSFSNKNVDALNAQIASLKSDKQELNNQVSTLNTQLVAVTKRLSTSDAAVTDLTKRLTNKRAELKRCRDKNKVPVKP